MTDLEADPPRFHPQTERLFIRSGPEFIQMSVTPTSLPFPSAQLTCCVVWCVVRCVRRCDRTCSVRVLYGLIGRSIPVTLTLKMSWGEKVQHALSLTGALNWRMSE